MTKKPLFDNIDSDKDLLIIDGERKPVEPPPEQKTTIDNQKLFEAARAKFAEQDDDTPYKKYFTVGKGEVTIDLDKSAIEPNVSVVLGGKKFADKYIKQLEKALYSKDDTNVSDMITIVMYYKFILENKYPIKIVSIKHKKRLPAYIKTLNDFYNTNRVTIDSIHTMLNGSFELPGGDK
jgi:hypothetical protein